MAYPYSSSFGRQRRLQRGFPEAADCSREAGTDGLPTFVSACLFCDTVHVLKIAVRAIGREYIRRLCAYDQRKEQRRNERPIEWEFVCRAIRDMNPATILDVGSGTTALPLVMASFGSEVRAIDNIRDYWPAGMQNRHWPVEDRDITKGIDGRYDLITCVSTA